MSSLASVFNSSSTLLTMDLYQRLHPGATQGRLVLVGRLATVAVCVVSLAWLPLVGRGTQLFIYVQRVSNYLSPPITAIFLVSLWPAAAEPAVLAALLLGLLLGMGT